MVELHFHLLVDFGVTLLAKDFLPFARPYQTKAGVRCRVLSPEDEILHLLLHAVHHEFARYCWLYDIWTYVRSQPTLDWDAVRRRSESLRLRAALGYAVEVLRRRVGLTCEGPSKPIRVGAFRRECASRLLRVYDAVASSNSSEILVSLLFKAALCDDPREAIAFLSHYLGRLARRRLQRTFPRIVPEEWSA